MNTGVAQNRGVPFIDFDIKKVISYTPAERCFRCLE